MKIAMEPIVEQSPGSPPRSSDPHPLAASGARACPVITGPEIGGSRSDSSFALQILCSQDWNGTAPSSPEHRVHHAILGPAVQEETFREHTLVASTDLFGHPAAGDVLDGHHDLQADEVRVLEGPIAE